MSRFLSVMPRLPVSELQQTLAFYTNLGVHARSALA